MARVSLINLIDLAGSERANATGATGDRLKRMRNQPGLSALGNVINALAKASDGKKRKKPVNIPYRGSKLTHLLKQSLGNSKTVMIAAISPADVNYKETLSTLQYADRAKQIKNKAVVNEDPTDALIRGLKEELERLKKQLAEQASTTRPSSRQLAAAAGSASKDSQEELKAKWAAEHETAMAELREQLVENERLMQEQNKTWEQRLKETEASSIEQSKQLAAQGATIGQIDDSVRERQRSEPHILNLNEDPLMSGIIVHFLDKDEVRIGRKDAEKTQDIALSGLSVNKEHAVITNAKGRLAVSIMEEGSKIVVNGKRVAGLVHLQHNDRLIIGNNHVFRVAIPASVDGRDEDSAKYDYAYAIHEVNEAAMAALTAGERAARSKQRRCERNGGKVKSLHASMEREKAKAKEESQKQEQAFREQQRLLEGKLKEQEELLKDVSFSETKAMTT